MADRDVIERLAAFWGRQVEALTRPARYKPHWKDHYVTAISGVEAVGWMLTLYHWLGARRRTKICAILAAWTPRIKPCPHYFGGAGDKICPDCTVARRDAYARRPEKAEHRRVWARDRYQKDPERFCAMVRARRRRNPETVRARERAARVRRRAKSTAEGQLDLTNASNR